MKTENPTDKTLSEKVSWIRKKITSFRLKDPSYAKFCEELPKYCIEKLKSIRKK